MSRLAGADTYLRSFGESMFDTSHVLGPYGYATGGRLQGLMGKVEENRTSAPDHSWLKIKVQNAHDVIKVVFAPQRFRTEASWLTNGAIIVLGGGVITPPVRTKYGSRRVQVRAPAVRSPQPADDRKTSDRRDAVAFTAFDANTAPADRTFDGRRADPHQTFRVHL